MKNNNNSSSGISIFSLLTIIFVVLKLVGVINWSWWWVLSPFLIGCAISVIIIVIYVIILERSGSCTVQKRSTGKWKF